MTASEPSLPTVPDLIAAQAARHGNRVTVVDGDVSMSFAELHHAGEGLAGGLAERGIGPGDRVAVWLPNSRWWLVALVAIARLGAVCVCVNTRFRGAELTDILARSGAKTLFYAPQFGAIDFESVLNEMDDAVVDALDLIVTCAGAQLAKTRPRSETVEALIGATAAPPALQSADRGVLMFTTSGTTSRQKFVLHEQSSLADHAADVASAFQYDRAGSVVLQALPLCGTFGLAQAFGAIAAGAPSIILPTFEASLARELIVRHRITGFNGSDEMFKRIIDGGNRTDLASLDWCGFASFAEPRPVDFARDCERAGLKLAGLYGMSEVQALFARQPETLAIEERALAGGAMTSSLAAARIGDPETGETLPDGVSGELYLRGPSLFREYFGDLPATEAALADDGFVRTGDLAHKTEDGRFIFETRMGDSLRLGGYLVNPSEIDAWLEQDRTIAAAQTVAAEIDGRLRPVSFVIPEPGEKTEETTLIAGCRENLARFKVPAHIVTIAEFPTTDGPNGRKIQRGRLRDMAAEIVARTKSG